MTEYCYYCGKPATRKMQLIHSGQTVYVCQHHVQEHMKIESGRNAGFGAGIG